MIENLAEKFIRGYFFFFFFSHAKINHLLLDIILNWL